MLNSKNRVTILKSNLGARGGLEKQTLKLAEAFSKRGLEVNILTNGWQSQNPLPYVVNNVVSTKKCGTRVFNRACEKWLKKTPSKVVFGLDRNRYQTHYRAGGGVHATYLRRRALTDSIFRRLSFQLNPRHRMFLRLEKQLFLDPLLQKLFVNSHMVKQEVIEEYGVVPDKISVVHNGVEWKEMAPLFTNWKQNRKELFKQYDLDPSVYHFLFVGKGFRRKGLGFLLSGLAQLRHRDWHLSVVGDDREAAYFSNLAKTLRLPVTFFGRTPSLPFYQLADTLCIPSCYDPFANVTVEALAMGVNIVTSQFNGGKEVINSKTGKIIEKLTDPESVAMTLKWALNHPKTPNSAATARNSVIHLDFSQQMKKMIDLTLNL